MSRELLRHIPMFVILVLVQVLILNNIQFLGVINPFLYVYFIIVLPFDTTRWQVLISAIVLGFTIDLFTGTIGLHMSASILIGFFRFHLLKGLTPRDGYEFGTVPGLRDMGIGWFVTYASIMVFVHHLYLFMLEVFRFSEFFSTFYRSFSSALFSMILILLVQLLTIRQRASA